MRTTLAIDTPTYERLAELARQSERSVSAEARVAIRRHLNDSADGQSVNKLAAAGAVRGGAAAA